MDYSKPPPAAKKIIGAESLPGGEDEHANLGYYKFNRFMAGPLPYHSVCESRGKLLVPLVTLRSSCTLTTKSNSIVSESLACSLPWQEGIEVAAECRGWWWQQPGFE